MSSYQKPDAGYQYLQPKAAGCSFCGATVIPQVAESVNPVTKQKEKQIRWYCGRCQNVIRMGRMA